VVHAAFNEGRPSGSLDRGIEGAPSTESGLQDTRTIGQKSSHGTRQDWISEQEDPSDLPWTENQEGQSCDTNGDAYRHVDVEVAVRAFANCDDNFG
jgi:hypothetical protein